MGEGKQVAMMIAKMRFLFVSGLMLTMFVGSTGLEATPQPQDQVLFTGRFDFSGASKPVFSHVGSSIKANFSGTGISATFSSVKGTSYLYVIIDGKADPQNRRLLKINRRSAKTFVLASHLPAGNHQVEIVKENQYDTKVSFHGFTVTGGSLLAKPARPALSLEFYGDSNPAGHSAWDVADKGAVINNEGYFTYPGITARLLNAEYHNISMGGIGITARAWRNMANFYNLIHMNDEATGSNLWDFSNYCPDAVIINVGSNDWLAGASKTDIKNGWKSFIINDLRSHYPKAHIVLADSYGWAFNELADYLQETVAELNAAGENNVSYVRFPRLWGQEHAVVNEHAGFANILAQHLAKELNLPLPALSDLSSFAPYGSVTNGSFEKSTLPGVADGWRPHGTVTLVKNASDAVSGTSYLRLYDRAWVHFANSANPGSQFVLTGWMRGARKGDLGKLKIEFKDQGQHTLGTNEGLVTLTNQWQKYTTTAVAPANTWSVWVVLVAEKYDHAFFDDVQMTYKLPGQGIPSGLRLTGRVLFPDSLAPQRMSLASSAGSSFPERGFTRKP